MWELSVLANLLISLAYAGISGAILVPLIRNGQVRANKLGVATAAIFFSCSVGHGMMGLHPLLPLLGDHSRYAEASRVVEWHETLWDLLTAGVGIYYWTLRRTYRELMRGAVLFEDLKKQQHVRDLEARTELVDVQTRASQERLDVLQTVFDSLDDSVVMTGADGEILAANVVAQQQLGVGPGAASTSYLSPVLAHTRADGTPMPPAERATAVALLTGRSVHGLKTGVRVANGKRRWLLVNATPLFHTGADTPYAVVTAARDVTDEHDAEVAKQLAAEELERARDAALAATAAKSAFLATMSHEIRTPMNAVIGMTGLLLETPLTDEQRDYAETAVSSGEALLVIINDILDFSKMESGELQLESEPFDLRGCVHRSLDLVRAQATRKGLELTVRFADDDPATVIGDADRIRQILGNLLTNAVKFTAAGRVGLEVRTRPEGTGLRVSIDVTDTGIGISAEGMSRLFRSFSQVDASTTRMYGGTGLGLAISRGLADAMGGALTVRSEPGVGSTFTFDAPFAIAAEPLGGTTRRSARRSLTGRRVLSGRRVLAVDDNPTNQQILRHSLEGWGIETTMLSSPAAALDLLAADPAAGFDLAILDMVLPGMDGRALAAGLRALPGGRRLPIILLSSMAEAGQLRADPLIAAVLNKPATDAVLHGAIVEALDAAEATTTASAPAAAGNDSGAPVRVLLAEDNLVNQKVAAILLGRLGCTTDIVENGRDAVSAVAERRYDVVLMDIQMPVMDGLEATRRIRAGMPADRQPHIVAMTASALLEERAAGAAAGMDAYLTKPVRYSDLADTIAGLRAAPADESPAATAATASGPAGDGSGR